MDYLLPDDATMSLMSKEYDALKKNSRNERASALQNAPDTGDKASDKASSIPDGNLHKPPAHSDSQFDNAQRDASPDVRRIDEKNGDSSASNGAQDGQSTDKSAQSPQDSGADSSQSPAAAPTLQGRPGPSVPNAAVLLLLYFRFGLGYNSGYGTEIFDADGGLGGIQSCKGTFRDLNRLV